MHVSSLFPSGLYCFTTWQAASKYPSQIFVFPSLGTFTRQILPHGTVARQEKEKLGTLAGMKFTYILCPSPRPHPQRWGSSLESFVFSFRACYVILLPQCFAKTAPAEGHRLRLGTLVPGSVQRPTKEWLCLRGFNLKKANGRIMEESRTETHSMVYPHSHWETDAA